MDTAFLKAFLPEIFFSVSIFLQIVFNSRFINKLDFNFPIIYKETIFQILLIFVCLGLAYNSLKIEGFFYSFLLLNDSGSSFLKLFFVFFCILSLIFISRSVFLQQINFFEFFSIFLLSVFALLLLINTSDILSMYLIIEMQALCFYILASFKRDSSYATEAGLKYFIAGSFISGIFLFGASILYGCLGTLNLNSLSALLSFVFQADDYLLKLLIVIGVLLITVTLLFKIAASPFHFWSPDVYEGSPLASTIIFSIVPKISLFTFFIRWVFSCSIFFLDIQFLFLIVSVLSVFFGTFFAIRQKRVKRLIIYSSIAQVGFLIAPFFNLSIDGFAYVYFFLFIYLVTSVLVWGNLVGFYINSYHFQNYSRKIQTFFISNLAGLSRANKIQGLSFIIIFFSISGIPPYSGFLAKILIFLSLIEFKRFLVAIILILLNMIAVYYYTRIIKITFFETKTLNNNNLEFQTNYNSYLYELSGFILVFLLVTLIYIFFNPTLFFIASHYTVLGIENF